MKPRLFAHPFSSYCQKVLIALYENDTAFEMRMLGPEDPTAHADLQRLWPLQRFPVLTDGDRTVVEASIIIEYLGLHHPGSAVLIPQAQDAALAVRTLDRIFDNYIMTPMQKLVGNQLRPEADRDAYGVAQARATLATAYAWLNQTLAGRSWAAGEDFSLADCAAAPALFYADWALGIDPALVHLRAYRTRLLARPSVARAVDEARPYRHLFPLGAPLCD
jgi:glutathione S-transferase